MGVMKSPEAPKAIARKKGVYGRDICSAIDIAIGNTIETAAAFVISDVNNTVMINNPVSVPTGPSEFEPVINRFARRPAVPDFSKATFKTSNLA